MEIGGSNMALWHPKENYDKSGLFEACMWTGDNLGFINDRFNTEFYADNNDTLWIRDGLGCRPGSYIALQDGEFKIYGDEPFSKLYQAYKE